jgi:endogenous inhibitor of DNA gyrase (YacG/DUF329 family)
MRYGEKYSSTDEAATAPAIDQIELASGWGECSICGTKTHWCDCNGGKPLCSEECADQKWQQFLAWSRKQSISLVKSIAAFDRNGLGF